MIDHSIRDGCLIFKVHVVPRSSRSEVIGEHNGSLRVRVAAPPVEGAANKEVIQVLAKTFNVPRSAVQILSGQHGRLKQVSITNGSHEQVQNALSVLASFARPGG